MHQVASAPPAPDVALKDIFAVTETGVQVLKAHGCFDSHNMAVYLKGDRASFVFDGKGKRQTLTLSAPGMEGTAALIARIKAG